MQVSDNLKKIYNCHSKREIQDWELWQINKYGKEALENVISNYTQNVIRLHTGPTTEQEL
jgi:hypothetical protein